MADIIDELQKFADSCGLDMDVRAAFCALSEEWDPDDAHGAALHASVEEQHWASGFVRTDSLDCLPPDLLRRDGNDPRTERALTRYLAVMRELPEVFVTEQFRTACAMSSNSAARAALALLLRHHCIELLPRLGAANTYRNLVRRHRENHR